MYEAELFLGLFILAVGLVGLIASFACIIEIANRKDMDTAGKIIWASIVLVLGWIGILAYLFGSERKKIMKNVEIKE